MARLFPTLPLRLAGSAGEHAKLELQRTLEGGLPGAYKLLLGMDWSRGTGRAGAARRDRHRGVKPGSRRAADAGQVR